MCIRDSPLFITEGTEVKEPIEAMPGCFRLSLDLLQNQMKAIADLGIKAVLLYVKVDDALKDNKGTEAVNPEGLMQKAIRKVKSITPQIVVMTDVALDPYSSYGHDGIVEDAKILNDSTVEVLSKMALSHALAGADFVAPSDMMDGRVLRIRTELDQAGFTDTGIMSYSAKYASSFYGPFREALDSSPGFGDKRSYQMDPANSDEAMHEIALDLAEGADFVIIKPGMPYLDVLARAKAEFGVPCVAYQVSGEYAMQCAAFANGWLDRDRTILETMLAFRRAGADAVLTYFAPEVAKLLHQKR